MQLCFDLSIFSRQLTQCHVENVLCIVVGSVLLTDEAKNGTVSLLSNGGQDVSISMDGMSGDRQRYQQQLQLIDEQVNLVIEPFLST